MAPLHAPAILHRAVDRDGHGLSRLVDRNENAGERRLARGASERKREQRDGEKPEPFHPCRFPSSPRYAAVP